MSKNIELDKFYTPSSVAKKCILIMINALVGKIEVTEFIEPSAGGGAFSNLIPECIAYDIEPEAENIIKQDFLSLELPYKKGRIVFGNPPFGDRNNLARSFFKKSVKIGDAVAFVLPVSQLNNKDSLYEFNLVESVDLGVLSYSGMSVHCCFNVYLRPDNGTLNDKQKLKIDGLSVFRDDQDGYMDILHDLCIFRRGSSAGKEKHKDQHTQTYKIVVENKSLVPYVKEKILGFDWIGYKKHQSAPGISKNDIYRLFNNEEWEKLNVE